jgi:hypothetical protein
MTTIAETRHFEHSERFFSPVFKREQKITKVGNQNTEPFPLANPETITDSFSPEANVAITLDAS